MVRPITYHMPNSSHLQTRGLRNISHNNHVILHCTQTTSKTAAHFSKIRYYLPFRDRKLSGISVTPSSQIRACVLLLLLSMSLRNTSVEGLQSHEVHTKFREVRPITSKL
jgi:hypothetical protein